MSADESDESGRKEAHDSRLLDWQKRFDYATHSDRLAAEIGIFVMKTMLLINGGGTIALIGAFAGLAKHAAVGGEIAKGGKYFLWGLTCAVVASMFAYFYQSAITSNEWFEMRKRFSGENSKPWASWIARALIVTTIVLLFVSFVCFVIGANHVLNALEFTTSINAGWML